MAENLRNNNGNRKLSSRLQRRAPASLQISPASSWNVAIPLLSPLVSSPPAVVDFKTTEESRQGQNGQNHTEKKTEKSVVFKKWQSAPFYYEPAPLRPSSFVVCELRNFRK
ncbi:hypothetical protein ACFE04_007000 [Oxalis oulophora]